MRTFVPDTVDRFTSIANMVRLTRRWRDDALCAETDPDAFFPEDDGDAEDAKRICARCDVRERCLAYALKADERIGVWGGLSAEERDRITEHRFGARLTGAKARRRERDATIMDMTARGMGAPSVAARIGVNERTVYRVLERHRAQAAGGGGTANVTVAETATAS
ncbi:WhiB family transcriptional regulator [Amycolatopsis azurea]|uniref:WhiB family transcriptional regulator n=1 Tax=Amycolatopsis azurea TaxID=36819 RepID=UPI00382D8429